MIKLHKMTWGEFNKHSHAPIGGNEDPSKVIPETYWFEQNGAWYQVDKGYIGWNITDEDGKDAGFCETLKELRQNGI